MVLFVGFPRGRHMGGLVDTPSRAEEWVSNTASACVHGVHLLASVRERCVMSSRGNVQMQAFGPIGPSTNTSASTVGLEPRCTEKQMFGLAMKDEPWWCKDYTAILTGAAHIANARYLRYIGAAALR